MPLDRLRLIYLWVDMQLNVMMAERNVSVSREMKT